MHEVFGNSPTKVADATHIVFHFFPGATIDCFAYSYDQGCQIFSLAYGQNPNKKWPKWLFAHSLQGLN